MWGRGSAQLIAGLGVFAVAWGAAYVFGAARVPLHIGANGIDRYGSLWGLLGPFALVTAFLTLFSIGLILPIAQIAAQERMTVSATGFAPAGPTVATEPDLYPAVGWCSAIVLTTSAALLTTIVFLPGTVAWSIPAAGSVGTVMWTVPIIVMVVRLRRRARAARSSRDIS